MKIRIDLRPLPWDFHQKAEPSHVAALRDRLNELSADYKPKRLAGPGNDYTQELTVPLDDTRLPGLLKQFDALLRKEKRPIAAAVSKVLEPKEIGLVRFLPLTIYGDPIDVNNYGEPLNPVALACEACKFPDLTRVPNPLLVNKALVKKQDVMHAGTVLIVRPAALEVLKQAIGDQIEFGDVRYVVKGKPDPKAPAPEDRLHWVRPKAMLGERDVAGTVLVNKRCSKCKSVLDFDLRMFDESRNAEGAGVQELDDDLKHFGSSPADLAALPLKWWFDDADHTTQRHWRVDFAISGALLEHLKSARLKGIGYNEASSAFTVKGQGAFVAAPRTFGNEKSAAPAKADKAAKPAKTAATSKPLAAADVKAFKDVPWVCDDKGYVYFHLASPEIVMLDPMTWEQDNSGPHRVKKFKKPGLYRMPVTAIKSADEDTGGVAVDSATLLLIDGAAFADLQEVYDWDKATGSNGSINIKYHQRLAEQIGSRFAVVTTPPRKFKSEFVGDGEYTLDPNKIEPTKPI